MNLRPWSLAILLALGCDAGPQGGPAKATPSGAPSAPASSGALPAAPASAASSAGVPASAAAPSASASGAPSADPGRLEAPGKPIQGGVLRAKVTGRVKQISFPGHKTTILDDGEFLIAFARTAPAKEKLVLTFDDGVVLERDFDVEQRTYETDRVDGLPKNQVELDPPTKKKLGEVEARLDELRMRFTKGSCYKESFVWPVKGKLSSRYGQPRVLNGTDAGPHWGVDIVAPRGTPVHAPACGKVVFAEKDLPLSGNVVVVDHGRGLTSTLIHLDTFKVKVGDEVHQGDELATVGITGRTNGAHLDWRMNLYDLRVDPELLAPPVH